MRLLIALLALALCGAEASAACGGGLFGRHRVRSKTVIRVTTTGCAPAAKAPAAPVAPPATKEAPKAPAPKKTAIRD